MSLLSFLFGGSKSRTTSTSARTSATARGRQRSREGIRCTHEFYEERGWRRHGSELRGFYRTRHGSFEGRIQDPFSSSPKFTIISPPSAVVNGSHGPCFRERRKDVFTVHFSPKPRDVNTGIMRIEHCITESLS